jgi:DNA-binding transcriptional LysR family regulator
MHFSFSEIQAFVAVVQSGTFTEAANQIHITQPALSRRIQLIEKALGEPLFERLPTGPKLTEAGQAFLPYAEAVLTALDKARDAARGTAKGEGGQVSLAALNVFCTERLVSALRQFRIDTPKADLSPSFHANTGNSVSEAVLNGNATLGLRYGYDPRLHSEVIGQDHQLIVCSPNHKLANAKKVSPHRLNDETWISYPLGTGHDVSSFWLTMSRHFGITGRHVLTTDSIAAQKSMIQADFGVGMVSSGSVASELRQGNLSVIDVAIPIPGALFPIVLVRRKGAFVSKISQRLAQRIIEAYDEQALQNGTVHS